MKQDLKKLKYSKEKLLLLNFASLNNVSLSYGNNQKFLIFTEIKRGLHKLDK